MIARWPHSDAPRQVLSGTAPRPSPSKGISGDDWPRVWRDHELESTYDVVIIGGGVHGLATAYYLATNHGITNVAVVDKGYLGGGGSGRNTAIVRSNYLTPEGVAFYDRSLTLYNSMAADLNINVMFSERGHMTLAHTDSALSTMHWRAEVNKLQGIDSSVIDPSEVKKTCAEPRRQFAPSISHTRGASPSTRWNHSTRRGRLGVCPSCRSSGCAPAPKDRGARHLV